MPAVATVDAHDEDPDVSLARAAAAAAAAEPAVVANDDDNVLRVRLPSSEWLWNAIAALGKGEADTPDRAAACSRALGTVTTIEIAKDLPSNSETSLRPFHLHVPERILELVSESKSGASNIVTAKARGRSYSSVSPATPESSEAAFIASLPSFPNVSRFIWRRERPPFNGDALWNSVRSLPKLKSLRIVDHGIPPYVRANFEGVGDRSPLESDAFLAFRNIAHFEFSTFFVGGDVPAEDEKAISALGSFLEKNAATLETIHIKFAEIDTALDVSSLLQTLRCPNLREFSLFGAFSSSSTISSFLNAHSSLVSLSLPPGIGLIDWAVLSIDQDALPRLQHLNCSSAIAARILDRVKENPYSKLWCLTGIDMHDAIYEDHLANVEPAKFRWNFEESSSQAPWRAPLLQALSLCKGITHVGLRETDVPMQVVDLLGVMPQLVWLDLGRQNPSVSAAQWAVLLGPHLPAIRTIHMLGFNIPIFPIPGPLPENTIAALTAYATSMHTLEAWDNWGWSILINRDNAGPHFEKVDRPSAKRRIFDVGRTLTNGDGSVSTPIYPSEAYGRATCRRFGGHSQPGPISAEVTFEG